MALQEELKRRFPPIILLLALLSAFPALSTDMYLPALPLLQQQWQVPLVTANMTLVAYFVTYCLFLLVYGPLSDRFGRRPPLLVGVVLFILACLVCALAKGPAVMIGGRILQGAGAAAASAIVFAVSKDRFTGQQRQRVFIQIGVIVATAPMIAPILGGWVLQLFSWHWIFVIQAVMATIALVGIVRMEETLILQGVPPVREVIFGYLRCLMNLHYMALLLTLAWTCIPVFAFIGSSSDLYITRFGYDERQFGYFFCFNSLAFILAPLGFTRASRRYPVTTLMPYAFWGMLVASLLLLIPMVPLPWRLTIPMFLMTFSFAFCRPAGNNLILEQVEQDTGSASSLMVFFYFLVGATGMWILSLEWQDKVFALGVMGALASGCTIMSWQLIKNRIRQLPL